MICRKLFTVVELRPMVHVAALCLFCLFVFANSLNATTDVEEILERHAEAMGGQEKWAAMKSYTLYQRRPEGREIVCYARKPFEFKFEYEVDGQLRTKSYDGKDGFISIGQTYQTMRPGEEIEMREEAVFYEELLFAREQGFSVLRAEDVELDGEGCFVLHLIKSDVDTQTYWLSQSDYLIRKTGEYSEDPAHAGIYYTTVFSDYRDVDGYPFPFLLRLYANDELRATMNYSKIIVNEEWPDYFFSFQPTTTSAYFDYVKDQFSDQKMHGFTFYQETVRFDESGIVVDTSIWFEAFQFPQNFRIDIGDSSDGNINLWRQDSLYVFRAGQLRHKAKEQHASLLLKNGFHSYTTTEILQRLDSLGIDHSIFRKDSVDGIPAYVIGAKPGDFSIPQVWLHQKHNYQIRRITYSNGKKLDFIYRDHQSYDGHWIEDQVDIYVDGRLIQKEQYKDVQIKAFINPDYFNPSRVGTTKIIDK